MAEAVHDKIIFRSLYKSPILEVSDYSCHLINNKPGNEEISTDNAIVLMRRGAFANILVVERSRPTSTRQFSFQKIRFIACVSWTKNVSTDLNVNRTWFYFLNQLGT